MRASRAVTQVFRLVVIASVGLDSVLALNAVWDCADVAMGVMALMNPAAITALGRWAVGALRHYEAAAAAGADPVFTTRDNAFLPRELPSKVWWRGDPLLFIRSLILSSTRDRVVCHASSGPPPPGDP